ncbi:hypothetical protein Bsph_1828 [Lysinibacillus sphaericus C3-41]|uniref:Uncharacterized protein n=1 Tax=Lysinibacillus sphaericus (strain C3-41) TaxID=444177 RepID=B1HSF1_LYSSC|nr:hypothetical protein Bsph_1828 [Lysinibacillus sphaericus C3-41]
MLYFQSKGVIMMLRNLSTMKKLLVLMLISIFTVGIIPSSWDTIR